MWDPGCFFIHFGQPAVGRIFHKHPVDLVSPLIQDEFWPAVCKDLQGPDQVDILQVDPVQPEKINHLGIFDDFPLLFASLGILLVQVTICNNTPPIVYILPFFQGSQRNGIFFQVFQYILGEKVIITPV